MSCVLLKVPADHSASPLFRNLCLPRRVRISEPKLYIVKM